MLVKLPIFSMNEVDLNRPQNNNVPPAASGISLKITLIAASVFFWLSGIALYVAHIFILNDKCSSIEPLCKGLFRALVPLTGMACMAGGSCTIVSLYFNCRKPKVELA